jgi:predicted GH43/DUF377 family glycosyl hydrolase
MSYAKIDREILVRHPDNPILTPADFPWRVRAVYNSSAVKTPGGRYVILCRVNELNHKTLLWPGDSDDGVHFTMRPQPHRMPDDPVWREAAGTVYYDPRVTYLDGEYKVLLAVQTAAASGRASGSRGRAHRQGGDKSLFIRGLCVSIPWDRIRSGRQVSTPLVCGRW